MKILRFLLLSLMLCCVSLPALAQTPKTGSISVVNHFVLKDPDGNDTSSTVSFTLIKDGDAVAAASLVSLHGNDSQAWENVLPGKYELHIDTLRFGSIVKHIGVLPSSRLLFDITDMPGDGKQVVQGKPTLFDLQRQIAELTAQLKTLTAKLAALEKAK